MLAIWKCFLDANTVKHTNKRRIILHKTERPLWVDSGSCAECEKIDAALCVVLIYYSCFAFIFLIFLPPQQAI
jgi:hypothetical protein